MATKKRPAPKKSTAKKPTPQKKAVSASHEKDFAPKAASTKNWAGQTVVREDKGRRMRAILAFGSQDVGDSANLIAEDEGVEIVGCSSDHTIVDVTDTGKTWKSGDTLTFKMRYANMLYAFTGDHIAVEYVKE